MTKQNTTFTRINKDTLEDVKDITREISLNEKKDIPISETLRRTFRIPVVKDILRQDSINKRRQR